MKVKIETGRIGNQSMVFYNDEPVNNIRSLNLKLAVNSANTIEVTYFHQAIEFEGEAEIIAIINNKKYKLIEGVF